MFFKKKETKEYSGKIDRFGTFADGSLSRTQVCYVMTLEGHESIFTIHAADHKPSLALSRSGDEVVLKFDHKDRLIEVENVTLGVKSESSVHFW